MGSIAKLEQRMALGPLDDSWYMPGGFFFGGIGPQTKAGTQVSEFNAMQLSVVWCCIKILAEDSASLPLDLFRRRKSGPGKDKAYDDPRHVIMHSRWNPEMTAMSGRETFASHLLSWGNGYAEKEMTPGRLAMLKNLWPIGPHRVTPKRDERRRLVYKVSMAGMNLADVALYRDRILHCPGLGYNGLIGYSPIAAARQAIGLGMALEEFGERYFGEGLHPGAVITHPNAIKDEKAFREAANEVYGGLGKSHRLMLLEDGMKIEKIGIPPEDSQFLETRKFQNVEIGTRIYRLPPQMYGEYDKASTYASAEQFSLDYVTKTLRPWLVRLEQSYNMALLDPSEYGEYFFEHNMEGLLRGDIKSRYEAYQIARRNGTLNGDEWREKENMNPMPDGQGEKYIVEKNMIELKDLGKVATEPFQQKGAAQ